MSIAGVSVGPVVPFNPARHYYGGHAQCGAAMYTRYVLQNGQPLTLRASNYLNLPVLHVIFLLVPACNDSIKHQIIDFHPFGTYHSLLPTGYYRYRIVSYCTAMPSVVDSGG